MSSRVIARARMDTGLSPVMVPTPVWRHVRTAVDETDEMMEETAASGAREEVLRQELAALQSRWEQMEAQHARDLHDLEERARESTRDVVDRFTRMIDDFSAQKGELVKSSEEIAVRLAIAVAGRIIGAAVVLNEEVVLGTVRRALKQVLQRESVVIRVNPDDLRIVRDHRSEWLGMMERARSVEITEDDHISRGGCLVETEAGNVEAQIENQLKTLERELVGKAR